MPMGGRPRRSVAPERGRRNEPAGARLLQPLGAGPTGVQGERPDMVERSGSPAGDLARLIETERRLQARLEEVDAEAGRIEAAARERAADLIGGVEADLERDVEVLRARLESDGVRQIEAIEREARTAIARYEGVTADRVDALAGYALRRAMGYAADEAASA